MWFKIGPKILNYTQHNESLSKRSDFTVLSCNLLFYLTNSPARNKQNKPQKTVCAWVCICLYVWFCWRAFVCLCAAERVESGYCQAVYLIEKPALWSRAASSISQRYASFLQLCIFRQTLRYTYVYVHRACMHSYKQCLPVYIPPTWSRHPFKVSNEVPLFSGPVTSLGYCRLARQVYFYRTAGIIFITAYSLTNKANS